MMNLALNELKLIANSRRIKAYKNMSKERLLSPLNESESIEGETNFDDARTKNIKKDFNELRDRFFKQKTKEVRRNLQEIENKNNPSTQKIKETEKNLHSS